MNIKWILLKIRWIIFTHPHTYEYQYDSHRRYVVLSCSLFFSSPFLWLTCGCCYCYFISSLFIIRTKFVLSTSNLCCLFPFLLVLPFLFLCCLMLLIQFLLSLILLMLVLHQSSLYSSILMFLFSIFSAWHNRRHPRLLWWYNSIINCSF